MEGVGGKPAGEAADTEHAEVGESGDGGVLPEGPAGADGWYA